MKIIPRRKIWFIISGLFVGASILFLLIWGLKPGIDFTGGSLLEVQFSQNSRSDNNLIRESLEKFNLGNIDIASSGNEGVILRFKEINEDEHKTAMAALEEKFEGVKELSFESVGPVAGSELKRKSISALIIVSVAIVLYVAWAFRKVSGSIASWKYGLAAVIALLHDVIIVAGVFAILGKFYGVEIGVPFIAALLTILGYSVNDTIVVFDRTRENLIIGRSGDYEEIVNKSINETIARSLNTSITTILALLAVYFFGGETTKMFMLALIIGCVVGTYSSIFLASPIMVVWERLRLKD